MNLFIDIGNTSLHWRLSGSLDIASPTISVRHNKDFAKALAILQASLGDVRVIRVLVANVAGNQAKETIETWSIENYSVKPLFLSSQEKHKQVVNAYIEPQRLGVDRWFAVLAGHKLIQKNTAFAALIVDAGTAMTIDAVLKDGTHLGGNIIAGLELQQKNLLSGTHDIQDSHGEESVWGSDTASAVANGASFALLGAICLAAEQLQKQITEGRIHILLTGGDAETLEPYFIGREDVSFSVHSNLVLDGLEVYLEK